MKQSAPRKCTSVNKTSFTTFRTSLLSIFIASAVASPAFAIDPVYVTQEKSYESSEDLFFHSYVHYSTHLPNSSTAASSGKYHSGVTVEDKGTASLTGKVIRADITNLSGVTTREGMTNSPSLRVFQASSGELKLGGAETEEISISVTDKYTESSALKGISLITGITAMTQKSSADEVGNIEITGKLLNINLDLSSGINGYGIHAQGNTFHPQIIVNADTYINAKGDNARAIVAMSGGKVTFNKNLFVNLGSDPAASTAIVTRGKGSVVINPQGEQKTAQINGAINYGYDDNSSKTPVDGHVEINLTGSESFWHGSAIITSPVILDEQAKEDKLKDKPSLTVKLKDGAVWNPTLVELKEDSSAGCTYYVAANHLGLDNGVVNVKNNGQPVIVQKLEGKGTINIEATKNDSGLTSGQFHVGSTELDGGKVEATKFNNAEDGTHLNVNFTGVTSDDINSEEFASLATNVKASGATQAHTVKEGFILGDRTQNVDPTGAVTSTSTAENTVNQSLRDIGAMTFLGFRTAINDLDKRLGDLRSYSGENGGWVRYLGGQHRYGDRNMKLNYNGFQAGFDHRFGEFYAGAAFGYTRGSGHLHNGSSKNNNWNFGLYGGWLGEKGQFVDVIVKRHRFKNEFNLHHTSGLLSGGSYHNWATSVSAEAGWRFSCPTTGFYAEPQAELSFGRMEKGSFTTNQGVKVKQNAINSTVGRLGVAAGYTLPDSKGNAYVKASVLHDWSAKVKGSMSKGNLKKSYRDDLGGTWAEFSVGGTYNATKNISAYGEFQTSTGSPVRSPWAASVGVRYNF